MRVCRGRARPRVFAFAIGSCSAGRRRSLRMHGLLGGRAGGHLWPLPGRVEHAAHSCRRQGRRWCSRCAARPRTHPACMPVCAWQRGGGVGGGALRCRVAPSQPPHSLLMRSTAMHEPAQSAACTGSVRHSRFSTARAVALLLPLTSCR